MARRKYPKLPNGFGSVKKLSGNRTNSFGVYPPVTEFRLNGSPVMPPALAYVDSWVKGVGVLTAYHNGTYVPGQEIPEHLTGTKQADIVRGILAEYNTAKRLKAVDAEPEPPKKTFAEVYADFFKWKYERDKSKNYSQNTINATRTAYLHLSELYDHPFSELRHDDMQRALDNSPYRHASIEQMVSLLHQMYKYALIYEIVNVNYSQYLQINIPDDDEPGEPFTDEELRQLWKHADDPHIELMLIICYSGYRITAYQTLTVNLEEGYFLGGVKTKKSKNRYVPIHSGIMELVRRRMERDGAMLNIGTSNFRPLLYKSLEMCGIKKHTPHDGRHTFSRLCEEARVNENDRKRMMGHSFGADITNGIYGHRTVEDLRAEIEKIKICR